MAKRVTLAEVAQRAGVNKSTVSRALIVGGSSQVSGATAERIRLIAAELGYLPDPAAASLRTGRSMVIGVLVPRVTDFVLASIYESISSRARTHGYTTLVANGEDDPAVRIQQLDGLLSRRVDGVVVGDARLDGDEVVATLRRRQIPYVLVNRRLHGHPGVTTDDIRGGELAADHLLRLGHHQVGILAGPGFTSTGVERVHGFTRTYYRSGHIVPPEMIVESSNDADGGHTAARTLLLRNSEITAIFATNDFAAIGAMGAAREHGRRAGQDLAVVGYNDIPLAQYLPLPLTSVHSPITEMGYGAADRLLRQLAGSDSEPATLLTPHLEVRASSSVEHLRRDSHRT